MKKYYLAIDIGASSGRHIVGRREGTEIKTDEVFRFSNGVCQENGHLVWNIAALFENVKAGIRSAKEKYGKIESLAIDTWGVDYALLNGDTLVSPCYAYRDSRTERAIAEVHKRIPFETLYQKTGIQFQPFNTLYQLYDDLTRGRLENATDFLMIPEYLSYLLTGEKAHEYTNATTTGLVNVRTGGYDQEIISAAGLPARLFGKLNRPRTFLGRYEGIDVVLCASHDTASAVEGIPMTENSPYLSSGTWSLLGLKVPHALTDGNSMRANYSNEGGAGYVRYQKNIMGMWVVNQLRKELCPEKPFPEIVEEARESRYENIVDVNGKAFLAPASMKRAFDEKLSEGPQTEGDYFRCAFVSLAASYKTALEELKANTGAEFQRLYIVGGGAKNSLLNELTEKACGIETIALPIEATALGNLKQQIIRGEGHV